MLACIAVSAGVSAVGAVLLSAWVGPTGAAASTVLGAASYVLLIRSDRKRIELVR